MNGYSDILEKYGVDAALVTTAPNTFYIGGYESSDCRILLTRDENYFFTDMRYFEEAEDFLKGKFRVYLGGIKEVSELAVKLGVKALGVERNVTYAEYKQFEELFDNIRFVAADDAFSDMRAVKSSEEIGQIKSAQSVTEAAFDEILHYIKEGVSEIEVAARLEYAILRRGCELAFDSIVAFGENGSKPHAHRSGRKLREGEFVTMDFGAKYRGYCSDMTRTVALGAVDERRARAYEAVLEANLAAERAIKPGERCCDIDLIARKSLAKHGLDGYFTHSLGHSVGVEIHEMPAFSPRCDSVLTAGNVITVEPGVYIPGQFGIRIEDMALITDGGVEILTHSDKRLITL